MARPPLPLHALQDVWFGEEDCVSKSSGRLEDFYNASALNLDPLPLRGLPLEEGRVQDSAESAEKSN